MSTMHTRSRGRPSNAEAPGRRAELLEVAARAFLANGYEGTSIETIASAARVSKATIYARFGSKENLFADIGLHSVAGMRGDLHGISTEGRTPAEVLFDFALRIAGEVADPERTATLRLAIACRPRFPEVARIVHTHIADTIRPLTDYIAVLQSEGRTGSGDPAELAAHFINLANGGLRFLLTDDFASPDFRRQWAEGVTRLFLGGLAGNIPHM
ncbi:MAG: TetR/AcrR family transcriptional regulator [Sphingomicrobium sp.]